MEPVTHNKEVFETSLRNSIFQERVSSWIRSYRNPEAMDWLRKFVDNSTEPDEVKQQLYREISYKEARLRAKPAFVQDGNDVFLMNQSGKAYEYGTRFSAVCKLAELALKGYEVELVQSGAIYKIKLLGPHILTSNGDIIAKGGPNVSK